MKVVYIAHPIGGDVERNLQEVSKIGRRINLNEPGVVPFAPYCLLDEVASERVRGIQNNMHWFESGVIDQVRLYGDRLSPGMLHEMKKAFELDIEVLPMTKGTREGLQEYLLTCEENQ